MFKGIFCPSITIVKEDGGIDKEMWGKHLDHLADAGIDGVLLFGSIGEFYAYPRSFKEDAVTFAVERVAGRMKVLVGVGGTDIGEVIALSRFSEKAGSDALVVISPYYFGPSEAAAKVYFGAIAQSVALPIMLYNFPQRTGSDLGPELVGTLARQYPNIVGIKDTVDTISHTRKVIATLKPAQSGFSVLSGYDEYYLVNRASGGQGVLCGLTNVEPETFVAMHKAYEKGDFCMVMKCAQRISTLMQLYDASDLFISAIKGAVAYKGLKIFTGIQGPSVKLTDQQCSRIEEIISTAPKLY